MYDGLQLQNYLPDLQTKQYGLPFKEDLKTVSNVASGNEGASDTTLNPFDAVPLACGGAKEGEGGAKQSEAMTTTEKRRNTSKGVAGSQAPAVSLPVADDDHFDHRNYGCLVDNSEMH